MQLTKQSIWYLLFRVTENVRANVEQDESGLETIF